MIAVQSKLDFHTVSNDIDQFVQELDVQLSLLSTANPKVYDSQYVEWPTSGSTSRGTTSSIGIESNSTIEVSRSDASQVFSDGGATCSTVYSDFDGSTTYGFSNSSSQKSRLCSSVLSDDIRKSVLLPSEISSICSSISNIRYLKMEIESSLYGKVAPEMCPNHIPPSLLLKCSLGSWKWYIAKSMPQLKAFDKLIRNYLDLEHVDIPKLPDLLSSTGPRVCHANSKAMEEYIVIVSAYISRLNDFALNEFASFVQSDSVVPSPIFSSSTYAYVKSTVGYKTRFCSFNNGSLQIYDAPGGRLLESISLYLSSVQLSESVRHGIILKEFDANTVNVKNQTLVCFESDLVCDKWLGILQDATYTKVPFSHSVAALPYTLVSWR